MAKSPRRGKGSGKTTDEGKISNSVSASDGTPVRADEAYTPSTPKPPQPRKAGRTDLNAAQGFQRQQQMAPHTTPKMSRSQQAKLDAMKTNTPGPRGMGMGSSSSTPEVEIEKVEFVRLERFEIDRLAMNSVRDEYAGRPAADLSHIHPDSFRAIEDAVPVAQDRFDQKRAEWAGVAANLSFLDITLMTAEGEKGATITRDGTTYFKEGIQLVVDKPGEARAWHEFGGVYDAVVEKPESQERPNATYPSGDRFAVFYGLGEDRTRFTDSLPWREEVDQERDEIRGALHEDPAVADRLYTGVLTPYERALEQVEQREPQEGQRHERAYLKLTGNEFPHLSTPSVEAPFVVTAEDMQSVENGFDQAPALAVQQGAKPVHDALPQEGRALTAEGLKEQYQWHSNKMFEEGRDLKDVYKSTGVKPEGADQTAWEKTEYVYGQPTALDQLQGLGKGAFAVSPTGYTYALSADGKELIRFDVDGNPAGQKPVEDVQAFLQEKRGVEFDQQQEAKEQKEAQRAEDKRFEDAVTEGKRPDDMSEAQWERELQALNASNEEQAEADKQWEEDIAIFERQQEFGSDPSVWTQEGYDQIRAEVLGGREDTGREENKFVEKDVLARDQFLSDEAEDRVEFDQQQEAMNDREAVSEIGAWPVAVRMDEIRSEVGETTSGMSAWQVERSYDDARSNLTAWDGNEMDTYVDLHARANLIGENAGYGQDRIYQDREYDIYRMSADAKYQLDNAGVNVDAIERDVDHRVGLHDEMAVLLQREEGRGVTKEEFVEARQAVSAYLSEMPGGHVHKSDSFDTYTLKGDELHIDFHANRDLGYTSVYDAKSIEWKGDLDHQTGVLHGASIAPEEKTTNEAAAHQETWSQSKELASKAVVEMNQMANQPLTESQQETAALLRGDISEVQQAQDIAAAPQEASEVKQEPAAKEKPEMVLQQNDKPAHEANGKANSDGNTEAAPGISTEQLPEVNGVPVPGIDTKPETQGEAKKDVEVDPALQMFRELKADIEAKEKASAPAVEKEASNEAGQQTAISEPQEQAASLKGSGDAALDHFRSTCAQQDQKEASQAQQPQQDEERRRGPEMAA